MSDENNYDITDSEIVNIEEFFIKEEPNEELVLDENAELLLREIKEENFESEDTCNKNENIKISNDPVSIEEKIEYECYVCHKTYLTKVKLESHIRLHGMKPNKCQNNNKKISNFEDLKQENEKNLYKCQICNKSFKLLQCLKRHQLTHTNKKPYTCEICNKAFRYLHNLKQHQSTHTGEKPYNCEACNKSFRKFSNLKRHRLTHTDEKPFTCEICNKSFRELQTLEKHKLVHTGRKPFTCEVCNKLFRQSHSLKRHLLTHTGEKPFTCEVCNKSFRQLSVLTRHKLLHTDEKPFICEVCNKSFRSSQNLKKHDLSRHGTKLVKKHSLTTFTASSPLRKKII